MKKTFFKTAFVLLTAIMTISCSKDSPTGTSSTPTPTCPQGYTGSNCSTQITPTKLTISKIEIVSFPAIDPTATTGLWDYNLLDTSQNAPDLAILLTNVTTSTLLTDTTSSPFMNASASQTYSYTYTTFNITNVNDLFKIELRDIDTSSPYYQSMNTYFFSIYSSLGGFPTVIPVINGQTKYNIYVSYTW